MKSTTLVQIILIASFFANSALGQTADTVLNFLKAPTSPAANLLGISPSDVQRPTAPTDFMLSVQNATNNYSVVPNSYAVDVAPVWLFNAEKIGFAQFLDDDYANVREAVRQTLVLSAAATSKADSIAGRSASVGFGLKFSIFRGKVNSQARQALLRIDSVWIKFDQYLDPAIKALWESEVFMNADSNEKERLKNAVTDSVKKSIPTLTDSLFSLAKEIDFTRYGWKLDVAGGVSMAFPGQLFKQGSVDRAGAWITGGYEGENGLAALVLVRYLYNPDKVFADEAGILQQDNLSTFDAGLRLLLDNRHKFTFSGEGVYRSVLNKTGVDPTWRFTLNADYKISPNRILTLALGRDYDGTFSKDGNLIAALNLVLGFGNNRGQQNAAAQ